MSLENLHFGIHKSANNSGLIMVFVVHFGNILKASILLFSVVVQTGLSLIWSVWVLWQQDSFSLYSYHSSLTVINGLVHLTLEV